MVPWNIGAQYCSLLPLLTWMVRYPRVAPVKSTSFVKAPVSLTAYDLSRSPFLTLTTPGGSPGGGTGGALVRFGTFGAAGLELAATGGVGFCCAAGVRAGA